MWNLLKRYCRSFFLWGAPIVRKIESVRAAGFLRDPVAEMWEIFWCYSGVALYSRFIILCCIHRRCRLRSKNRVVRLRRGKKFRATWNKAFVNGNIFCSKKNNCGQVGIHTIMKELSKRVYTRICMRALASSLIWGTYICICALPGAILNQAPCKEEWKMEQKIPPFCCLVMRRSFWYEDRFFPFQSFPLISN